MSQRFHSSASDDGQAEQKHFHFRKNSSDIRDIMSKSNKIHYFLLNFIYLLQ